MGDATDMEHDTEEGPGGDVTVREEEPRGMTDSKRREYGHTLDTEGPGREKQQKMKQE